ncbi:MAG: ATP-binding cassette domain-containing protein [Verrucomicrobiales bacterium]
MSEHNPHIEFRNVTVRYGSDIALDGLDFFIRKNTIFGIVGPANSGKTTLLKCINRTIDFISTASVEGRVTLDGEDVRSIKNVYSLRRRIGMVFPLPVGLPLSIYENVAYGPRRAGIHDKESLDEIVERCLPLSRPLGRGQGPPQLSRHEAFRAVSSSGSPSPAPLSLEPRDPLPRRILDRSIDPVTTMRSRTSLVDLKGRR